VRRGFDSATATSPRTSIAPSASLTGLPRARVTAELCDRLGVRVALLPVTDSAVATMFDTELGRMSFQEYFVRHHHDVTVTAIDIVGVEAATASPQVLDALRDASRIVIAPSNPLISVDPILRVRGVRDVLERRRDDVIGISPIIAGQALKGPADRLLAPELGHEVSCLGVLDFYKGLIGTWIIDEADAQRADDVRGRDVDVIVTTTIMAEPENAERLAAAVLA
jgi:LPPG:FO 2-phospho-L-lactate transferase